MNIHAEAGVSKADIEHLKQIGYKIQPPLPSFVYAVERAATKIENSAATGIADYVAEEEKPPGIREPNPIVTRAQ